MGLPSGDRLHRSCMKFLIDFRALFIRTFLLAKRKRAQTIIEIILAYTFIGILLGIRYITHFSGYSAFQIPRFRPQDLMLFNGSSGNVTYYYPSNPCTDTIVTDAMNALALTWSNFPNIVQVIPNPDISSLSSSTLESIYAYIYFTNIDSSCTSPSTMPDQINYTLRMQENGPFSYVAQSVKLDDNNIFWKRSPESYCQDTNSLVNYITQFLGVQYYIDLSIIQYATNGIQNSFGANSSIIQNGTNETQNPSGIYMNHFGCPQYYHDEIHSEFSFLITMLYSLIYMITFLMNVDYIVEERENKTKEYLSIFGLRSWINNLIWIIRSMCIFVVLTCFLTGFSVLVLSNSGGYSNNLGKAIFNFTHWTLIWTILFVYSIQVSTFSVFFGQFFTNSILAKLLGFALWIITSVDFYSGAPVAIRYLMCLFPNTGLMFCLEVLSQYERKSAGIATFEQLYSNLFTYQLYIGICLLLMLIYSLIYFILAIYIGFINPGKFGISQPWNYLFKKSYWKPQLSSPLRLMDNFTEINLYKSNKHGEHYDNNRWMQENFHENAKVPSVTIRRLTKKFGKFGAISNLSLNFYKGEVCTLLGHNGAGKTTALFILVGILEPTSGSVTVEGLDNRQHIQIVRKMLGFCPQYDILYNELSVKEHLELIAKLRHMETNVIKESIKTILHLIELVNDQQTLAKNLSGGMKRRLSIGIALVGDPKVLILDEPTSGIDPYNRRLIWTIIRKLKEVGKCVILTTHFLDEADVLSDRIAIMTKGRLQANGTPDFLKQQTEFEYRLFIKKQDELCDSQRVSQFIQAYVETSILERESPSELIYGIKRDGSKQIEQLINALDQPHDDIAINGYSLSMTTIEEVFLRLVREAEEAEEDYDPDREKTKRELADKVFRTRHEYITGIHLFRTRVWALLVKRWIVLRRQLIFLFGFFLSPIIIEILTVAALPTPQEIQESLYLNGRVPNAEVILVPSIYNPQTIVTYANNDENNIPSQLRTYLENMGATLDKIEIDNVLNYVVARYNESENTFVNKYQMGFSLYNDLTSSIPLFIFNAYFSTVNYHTMATSLGVIATNLFQSYTNSSSKNIITTNQPIITNSKVSGVEEYLQSTYCFDILPVSLFNILNCIIGSIFISILIMTHARERITHSKDLQLLTNLTKGLYWFSNTIFDLILCFILCSLLTIIIKISATAVSNSQAEVHIYTNVEQTGYFFLMMIMYSLSSLPLIYAFSFTPKSESLGFLNFFLINIVACILDMVLNFIGIYSQVSKIARTTKTTGVTQLTTTMNNIRWLVSVLFPSVNLKDAIYNIRLNSDKNCILAINSIMYTNYSFNEPWMSLNKPGLGINFIIFSSQIIIWWIILTLIENRLTIKQIWQRFCCCNGLEKAKGNTDGDESNKDKGALPSSIPHKWDDSHLDEDVRNERRIILTEDELSRSSVILVRDLVRKFKKRKKRSIFRRVYTAVDHLNFRVEKQSCFGLLGPNGAGKTTTFRMMINDIIPTSGQIIINGKNINKMQRDIGIGFCPQFDWLVENLNVMETLVLFARLKGLKADEIPDICHNMIKLFDLNTYEKRQVQKLSGGNKRKVSAALAFMANPTLVFLDEPTTGLDAAAKRKLWNVIRTARDVGLTIIMTSHSIEECEALCTKIGIMKSGQFMCLGSLQHLKNRFGNGYIVQVKISIDRINKFKNELFETFPGIQIKDQNNGMLFCNVPLSSSSKNDNRCDTIVSFNLADVFEMFNKKKEEKIIESYAITQTTLEQIFVHIVGQNDCVDSVSVENISINVTPNIEQIFPSNSTVSALDEKCTRL